MRKGRKSRTYDASRRQLAARERREQVLQVALRLFAERGFTETTMDAIAAEAGIATPTLYAGFQSKRGILDALLKRLVSGMPDGTPLVETARARSVVAARDPRRVIARFVTDLGRVQESVIPLYQVLTHAARTEPEVAEFLAAAQAYRFSNVATVARRLAELGALRSHLSEDAAARTIWAIASPEVRQMLLTFAGWSKARYQRWLREILAASLLRPR